MSIIYNANEFDKSKETYITASMLNNRLSQLGTYSPNVFIEPKEERCLMNKKATLTSKQWTVVSSMTGAGVLNKIWLSIFNVNPALVSLKVSFDASILPQIGTNTPPGDSSTSLSLDVLLSSGFGSSDYYFATDQQGCNNLSANSIGGYIQLDAPYSNGAVISLYNNNTGSGFLWSQAFYTPLTISPTPLRLYIKPFWYNNITNVGSTRFLEMPLISVISQNGVYMKGTKFFIISSQDKGWYEGRVRAYNGGPGMTQPMLYTATQPNNISYYNVLSGVEQVYSSSGMENFFLTSFTFTGLKLFANNTSGIIRMSNLSAPHIGQLCLYRNFIGKGPSAPPNTQFTATVTLGDQNDITSGGGTPATLNFILGYNSWYA